MQQIAVEWPLRLLWRCLDMLLWILPVRLLRAFLTACDRRPALMDRAGFHVRRIGFSDPLPDFRSIGGRNFAVRRAGRDIDWRFENQAALIGRLGRRMTEVREFEDSSSPQAFDFRNGYYDDADAKVLYLLLREMKPRRLVEVGSGRSTRLASWALWKNAEQDRADSAHTCIDPFENDRVGELRHPVRFVRSPVEEMDVGFFGQLEAGDVLFIDSTHTVRVFGDVVHLLLGVLPSLKAGVWVHFHDIFLPYEYPRNWIVDERRGWNEQYLLEAYLSGNPKWRIELAVHALCRDHATLLSGLGYRGQGAGINSAFWISHNTIP